MSGGIRRLSVVAAFLLLPAPAPVSAAEPPATGETLQLSSDLRVAVRQGRDIELQVLCAANGDYASIARRVARGDSAAEALAAWNDEPRARPGSWVRVPLALLSDDYRFLVLRNLFPDDRGDGKDWIHVARSGSLPTYDEGLWQVAEWFGGNGAAFDELMRANDLSSPELRPGQSVRVPAKLLAPGFRAPARPGNGPLYFATDARGPYAGYRLQPGEALYSAVVVRFTGRTGSDDVRRLAEEIGKRSDIADMRDIPAWYEVKIPLELLVPDHLPADHPRRIEAEERRAELSRELALAPVAGTHGGLEGVVIVLDPGHGGRDLGTMNNGIWEHDYVYDVTCRLKGLLEAQTAATVYMTLEDRETGCVPSRTDKLVANRQGTILTRPNFLARQDGEAKIGVNLRWYLANSIYRRHLKQGQRDDRVVFLSLHADSRHPALAGVMAYVPGADYRTRTYGSTSKTYRRYEEVREKPTIRFSRKERVRSEAVSRKLANAVVESFRAEGLPVQPYQPVRNKVIRGKNKWVPAVLRGNMIPAKVLVEMVNLSNRKDAALLASGTHRQRMADALLQSLYRYFGEKSPSLAASAGSETR